MAEGRGWVVDLDLERFFDRVNHDVLMGRLAKRIGDRRLLWLVRRHLEAGVLFNGVVVEREEGTPQGGPLLPLLANVLLDEWDKERRGHRFCRYADGCNIYVRSQRAGERVLASVSRWLERVLRLKVNGAKSAVGRPAERPFLGYRIIVVATARLLRGAEKPCASQGDDSADHAAQPRGEPGAHAGGLLRRITLGSGEEGLCVGVGRIEPQDLPGQVSNGPPVILGNGLVGLIEQTIDVALDALARHTRPDLWTQSSDRWIEPPRMGRAHHRAAGVGASTQPEPGELDS